MDGYSAEEWNVVVAAPMSAGLGVMGADFSIISVYSEFKETIRAVMDGGQHFPQSKVIQELMTAYENSGNQQPPTNGSGSATDVILKQVGQARGLVRAKSGDQEAQFYADFIREIAKRTAEASGEGLFGTGEKVSGKERSYLENLEKALAG